MTTIDEATLAQIETELGADGVWVAPQLRQQVPKDVEARIEAAVAEAPESTYVTLVELDHEDQLTAGKADELANLIRDDTGRSGIYVGLEPRYGDDPYTLELTSFPKDYGLYQAARVAAVEHPDDLGAQALRTLDLLRTGGAEKLYEELDPDDREQFSGTSSSGSGDGDEGVSPGVVTGVVVGVLAVVAIVVATRRRRARSRAVAPTPTGAPFTLPPAVLSTVRAAEDQRTEARAQAEVLELGEAIDATELDPRRSRALPSWQAALDHYDVARRILDRDHSPADAVGALVLTRRGHTALAAAARGRGWQPSPSCYFNPLHAGATTPVLWRDEEQRVRVPACPPCADAVRSDQEPEDVLDFVAAGRPVHYFKLDLGPWSRTGYGALDTDLLGRLLTR